MKVTELFITPEIGDEVYSTFGGKPRGILVSYRDNNKSKLVLDTTAPGGWVPSDKVRPNYKKIRLLTPLELAIEDRNYNNINRLANKSYNLAKRSVKGEVVEITGTNFIEDTISVKGFSGSLFSTFFTLADTPILDERDFHLKLNKSKFNFRIRENGLLPSIGKILKTVIADLIVEKYTVRDNLSFFILNGLYNESPKIQVEFTEGDVTYKVCAPVPITLYELWKGDRLIIPLTGYDLDFAVKIIKAKKSEKPVEPVVKTYEESGFFLPIEEDITERGWPSNIRNADYIGIPDHWKEHVNAAIEEGMSFEEFLADMEQMDDERADMAENNEQGGLVLLDLNEDDLTLDETEF